MSGSPLHVVQIFLEQTALHTLVNRSVWMWAAFESLHFIGMSVLIGTIGLFDLRLLGYARGIPYAAFHRLIPIGVAAFLVNAVTGLSFLTGAPDQYLYNAAFQVKVCCLAIAGVNVVLFYAGTFRTLATLAPDAAPPLRARLAGGISLCAWVGVMTAGRLLTFYRGVTGLTLAP